MVRGLGDCYYSAIEVFGSDGVLASYVAGEFGVGQRYFYRYLSTLVFSRKSVFDDYLLRVEYPSREEMRSVFGLGVDRFGSIGGICRRLASAKCSYHKLYYHLSKVKNCEVPKICSPHIIIIYRQLKGVLKNG